MRRLSLLTVTLLATTGCVDFEFDLADFLDSLEDAGSFEGGQLYTESRGVVIHDNGDDAHVGMSGTTCEVDTDGGYIGTDHDVSWSDDEVVVDSKTEPAGDIVLVTTSDTVNVVHKDDFFGDQQEDFQVPGTIDAQFSDEGIIVLSDDPGTGCSVSWIDRTNGSTRVEPVAESNCDGWATLSVDPYLGDAYVTGSGGVNRISPDGLEHPVEEGADIAVWDSYSEVLYVANRGDSELRGLEANGVEIWSIDVGAAIISVEDAGVREGAIVLAEVNGNDQVLFVEGDTGSMGLELEIPGAGATDIAVSNDGQSIALIKSNEVFFTRLR